MEADVEFVASKPAAKNSGRSYPCWDEYHDETSGWSTNAASKLEEISPMEMTIEEIET
jgi:hypothetical protein